MKTILFDPTNREALYDYAVEHKYYDCDKNTDLVSLNRYIHDGDIADFLSTGGKTVDPFSVIYMGGNITLEILKQRIGVFWKEATTSPENYKGRLNFPKSGSIDDWLLIGITAFFKRGYGCYLSNEEYVDLFKWVYGESFAFEREITIDLKDESVSWTIEIDPTYQFGSLLLLMSEYLFDMDETYLTDPDRVNSLGEYFFTCLPHIDENIFSKTLYHRRHVSDDGTPSNYSSKQSVLRRFIALMYGILRKSEIENKKYQEVIVYKPNELEDFKVMFEANVPNSDKYFELVEFIKEAGANYPKATIN